MARSYIQGFAEIGGQGVVTDGRTSTTDVQRSFPGATVDVFLGGTSTPASIYSNVGGTPKANPFLADSNGYWSFWADDGTYDVRLSGAGITSPFTLFNFVIGQSGALNDPGSNGILARTAPNTVIPRTILGTSSEIVVTNGLGDTGNPTISLSSFLDLTTKTLSGGTYLSPAIANFGNAQHLHADGGGGGQLNASNVFSTGTVPVARLPVMVGATGGSNGTAGLVPQPLIADVGNFLRGDGTWATAGGGGGGTPGGGANTVQYNNGGSFGGVTGATSDGTNITFGSTNLRATRPRFVTSIDDTNGNELFGINSVGSAVNEITIANAAAGGSPALSATGGDTNINIVLTPKGTGMISTAGNIQISNNTPQVTLVDVNDSKQVRFFLSGGNCGIINDTLGQTPLNIDTTNNTVTLIASLNIAAVNPAIIFDTSSGTDAKIDHSSSVLRFGSTGANYIQLDVTTGVTTFLTGIPVLPASNPTTANQAARKQYVDDTSVGMSANWYEYDPSASTTGNEDRPAFITPDGNGMTINKWRVYYSAGSHTSGGSVSFTLRWRPSGGGISDLATITLDNTNNTVNTNYTASFGPTSLTQGDRLTYYISARSGTVSERAVTICVLGTQKRI